MKVKKGPAAPAQEEVGATPVAVIEETPAPAPIEEDPAPVTVEVPEVPKILRERTFMKELECELSDAEMLVLGKELARANTDLEEQEERKKEVTKQLAADVEAARNTAVSLSRRLNRGTEYRKVECREVSDVVMLMVHTYRTDTGELVTKRVMEPHERQVAIDFSHRVAEQAELAADVVEAAEEIAAAPDVVEP